MDTQKKAMTKWIALIIIIVVLGGLVAFLMWSKSNTEESREIYPEATEQTGKPSGTTQTPTPSIPTPDTTATQPSTYKDGTYKATGTYASPAGEETLDVSLTLKDGVVTLLSVTGNASNPASKNWQTKFIADVNAQVVGKKLNEVQVDSVSGSSLTPAGFMDAIAKIKTQAKA